MGSIITKRKLLSAVNPVFDSIEDDEIKTWLSLTISSLQKDFGSYELGKHQILQTSKRLQDNKTFQEQFGFLNMTAKILVDFGLIDEMKDILAILPLKEIRNDVVCASVNIVDIEQIWLSVIDQLLNLNKLNDVKIIVQNMNDQCISGSAKQFMNVVAGLYLSNEREIAQEFFKKNIYFFQSFGFTVTIFIAMKFADFGLFTLAGFLSTAEKESNDQILYDWTLAYIEAKKKNFTLVRELIEKYSFGEELPDTITHYNYCDLIVMLLKIGEIFEQNEKELAKKVNIFAFYIFKKHFIAKYIYDWSNLANSYGLDAPLYIISSFLKYELIRFEDISDKFRVSCSNLDYDCKSNLQEIYQIVYENVNSKKKFGTLRSELEKTVTRDYYRGENLEFLLEYYHKNKRDAEIFGIIKKFDRSMGSRSKSKGIIKELDLHWYKFHYNPNLDINFYYIFGMLLTNLPVDMVKELVDCLRTEEIKICGYLKIAENYIERKEFSNALKTLKLIKGIPFEASFLKVMEKLINAISTEEDYDILMENCKSVHPESEKWFEIH